MLLEKASPEVIWKKIDEIRSKNPFALGNIFLNYNEIHDIFKKKECLFLQDDNAIFILIPYHNTFYDILYTALNDEALKHIIDNFKLLYDRKLKVRVSIVGKEDKAESVVSIFAERGFYLGKKLARTLSRKTNKEVHDVISSLSLSSKLAGAQSDKLTDENVSFAVAGDEKEILSLLLEEFDPSDDNIPELEAISENINKKQVVVIKDNGAIVCLHYFEIKDGKYYGIYDVTRKEYRGEFLFFAIPKFLDQYFIKNNIVINRSYGWRDTANKRLMKYAILNNQIPDGIYIYNMKWDGK